MKISTLALSAILLAQPAAAQVAEPARAAADDPRLAMVIADLGAYYRSVDPALAAREGDRSAAGRTRDPTRAFEQAQQAPLRAFLERVEAIPAAALGPGDRINSALAPHNIETELQRYIGWPGQATAYKIGEIRLRQIRARAEAALGERFDVRRFHDALLVDGALPLDLLDQRMDAWIAEQKRD